MKNNKNRVKKVKCDDHVIQSRSNANSVSVSINNAHVTNSVNDVKSGCLCVMCVKCMIAETQHECVQLVVTKINESKKSKSAKKHKKQNVWKPTGHVFTEVGLKWKPTGRTFTIVDSGCSKHMIWNRSQLMNFVNKFLGTVRFGNDQIARIMGLRAGYGTDDYLISTLDAPSTSIPSSQAQERPPIISQGFKESPKTLTFHDDPLNESLQDSPSQRSSSNVIQIYTLFERLGRWTKDHPIANVIGDPSRSVSTRKQLETDAMWCYFDAFHTSRPDLICVVCLCARYQAKPTEKHLQAVKQTIRYLKGTINMGLWYSKDTDMSLTAYKDADHVGCQDTRCSTSGTAQFLGDKLVS
nr:uncharacterized mitochondrial protein AtMg00810-like [Tanacetum cinerariifolium]